MALGEGRARLGGSGAPFIVINGEGQEVGVVVAYDQYLWLLGLVSGRVGRVGLSAYWRRALDGCSVVEGGGQPGAMPQGPGPGTIVPELPPEVARTSAVVG